MSKRFSLSGLMHNRKAMIVFSLIAAVFIWGSVVYGASGDEERSLRLTVPVDLTDTYAGSLGLCVIGENTFEVQVTVTGKPSVIFQLDEEDLRVRADTSTIYSAGKKSLSVIATRNSTESDYTIASVYPSTVTVTCDYWDTGLTYKVGVDTGDVKVADEKQHRLGDAVLDTTLLPDGNVTLEGPRSVTSQIDSIVARITESATISETQAFGATLVALNEKGEEVDVSSCKFTGLETPDVNVTVPVWVARTVEFTCDMLNVPAGLAGNKELLTISPSSIVVVGPEADVVAFAESVKKLPTLDFDHLAPAGLTQKIALNVPSSVRVLDDTKEVTLSVNLGDYSAKSFTINMGTAENNVTVSGLPAGMTATVPTQSVTFMVVGKARQLEKLDVEDFVGEIALAGEVIAGMERYTLRIINKAYDTMWVCYGEDAAGISVYVTIT